MLFSNQRKHKVSLPAIDPSGSPATIAFLITWLCTNLMKDPRKEMFVLDDSVYDTQMTSDTVQMLTNNRRPGILVLINDADWELEGEEKYELQPADNVVFVSTLHGG